MLYFIINPNARTGLGKKIWTQVEQELILKNISYNATVTTHRGHASKEARLIASTVESPTIIILGGDGTINEVVNGLREYSTITIGYIPTGSSNDFCRSMKLPSTPSEALHTILTSKNRTTVDIGRVAYNQKVRNFSVSCGIGFDALVAQRVQTSHLKKFFNKIKLGKLVYAAVALQQLALYKPDSINVTVDNKQYTFDKTVFVAIMNQPYEGGGLKFCPQAVSNDSMLDLCVASNISKLKILFLLPLAFKGLHKYFNGVTMLRGSSIQLSTVEPHFMHTDGESLPLITSLSATCCSTQINLIIP